MKPKSKHSNPTQRLKVYRHLKKIGPLTARKADRTYGIMCLASRIKELREAGIIIADSWVKRNGKRYKSYSLARA